MKAEITKEIEKFSKLGWKSSDRGSDVIFIDIFNKLEINRQFEETQIHKLTCKLLTEILGYDLEIEDDSVMSDFLWAVIDTTYRSALKTAGHTIGANPKGFQLLVEDYADSGKKIPLDKIEEWSEEAAED